MRSNNDGQRRQHRIREEGQVLPLTPGLQLPQRIQQKLALEQWLDILDLHPWILVQAQEESLQRKGQRCLQMGDVDIVEGSTTGLRSVRQGRRL